ncbi:MerR family transcriptional regulator [Lachnospiraceae bacterium 54-53]
MPRYTTGEMAKLCNVSVRTVQFYDAKELLKPSELSEGGRRLYSEDDLNKLHLICLLKSLGLTLGSIKGIIDSDCPGKVLLLLLDEQRKQIESEIKDRKQQLVSIQLIRESIHNEDRIPVTSMSDIEYMMNNKQKLNKTYTIMFVLGLFMTVIEIGTLAVWITKGIWLPFAAGMTIVVLAGILLTRMYYQSVEYICPQCSTRFKPAIGKFLISNHTPKTRKLKCPQCGHMGYCVEAASENICGQVPAQGFV